MLRGAWCGAGLLLLSLAAAAPAAAQQGETADHWQFVVSPYLLLPHMNGTVGVGPVNIDLDASPGDIFSNLKFGAMLVVEAKKGPWAIGMNGLYMNLGNDMSKLIGPNGGVTLSGSAEAKQGVVELTGFREVSPFLELLAGGRVNFVGTTLAVDAPNDVLSADISQTWFDPFVGGRLRVPGTGRWRIAARGDIGGFGVGSDLAWQARGTVGYQVSRLLEVAAAYWVVNMDYKGDLKNGTFRYDVTTFGPELALAFHF